MVTPNPDPTSRYPNAYCKTCGGGWPEYIRCALWSKQEVKGEGCDFTGEVELTAEMITLAEMFARGEVPAGTRKLPSVGWSVPKADPNAGWGVPKTGWHVPKGK